MGSKWCDKAKGGEELQQFSANVEMERQSYRALLMLM